MDTLTDGELAHEVNKTNLLLIEALQNLEALNATIAHLQQTEKELLKEQRHRGCFCVAGTSNYKMYRKWI